MRLTIVGSGDAFGSGGRGNTCFYLETAKAVLLGRLRRLRLPGVESTALEPNRIDAIVLSHLHGDHFGGLPFLAARWTISIAPREAAAHRGSARHARAAGCGARSLFPEGQRIEVAIYVAGRWKSYPRRARRCARARAADRGGDPPIRRAVDRATPVGWREGIRLFRRYRMDRCLAADRGRSRSVHQRMLRLCGQDNRPHELGNSQGAVARSCARGKSWSRT